MTDTIVAPITPVVMAPVITLRISGPCALKVYSLMTPAITTPTPNAMKKYTFYANSNISDDVLSVYFKAPKSYTGEDVVEISFHGNPIIAKAALNAIYNLDIRQAEPGEFSKRAFLNGKMDLAQAESIQTLIAAKSEIAAAASYKQLSGTTSCGIENLKNKLLDAKALVEAVLDFPDDDDMPNITLQVSDIALAVENECTTLINSYELLRKTDTGINIAIAGKPNVGKSSLLNALLKEDRAIVSETPGTTRDYIKENLYIGSLPLTITDTAGIRNTNNNIEAEGVRRSELKILEADIILVVLDISQPMDENDQKIITLTKNNTRIIIGNKLDKCTTPPQNNCTNINISAQTGQNINQLTSLIASLTSNQDTDKISTKASVTERHTYLLKQIKTILHSITESNNKKPLDMTYLDLANTISLFEEITGEKYTEEILSRIFNKFCIGK